VSPLLVLHRRRSLLLRKTEPVTRSLVALLPWYAGVGLWLLEIAAIAGLIAPALVGREVEMSRTGTTPRDWIFELGHWFERRGRKWLGRRLMWWSA
jgi:hypothetical protein